MLMLAIGSKVKSIHIASAVYYGGGGGVYYYYDVYFHTFGSMEMYECPSHNKMSLSIVYEGKGVLLHNSFIIYAQSLLYELSPPRWQ